MQGLHSRTWPRRPCQVVNKEETECRPVPGQLSVTAVSMACEWGGPRGLWALECFCGRWSRWKALGVLGALR